MWHHDENAKKACVLFPAVSSTGWAQKGGVEGMKLVNAEISRIGILREIVKIHRVVSRSRPGVFSGIGIVPGLAPTGSGSSRDSTGLPKFQD